MINYGFTVGTVGYTPDPSIYKHGNGQKSLDDQDNIEEVELLQINSSIYPVIVTTNYWFDKTRIR